VQESASARATSFLSPMLVIPPTASAGRHCHTTLSQVWLTDEIRKPQCAFEMSMFMCPAVHMSTRSLQRPSSTHEPSDPPFRVVISSFSPLQRSEDARRATHLLDKRSKKFKAGVAKIIQNLGHRPLLCATRKRRVPRLRGQRNPPPRNAQTPASGSSRVASELGRTG
jgi:hypothetical protein